MTGSRPSDLRACPACGGPVGTRDRPARPDDASVRADASESLPVWGANAMRAACARRDVVGVFALLHRSGASQRQLAALCGMYQSEVSDTMAARGRRIVSVDVLERVADGLGTPRSWWGLAHDDASAALLDVSESQGGAMNAGQLTVAPKRMAEPYARESRG